MYNEDLSTVARKNTKNYNSGNSPEIHDNLNVERGNNMLGKIDIMANSRT